MEGEWGGRMMGVGEGGDRGGGCNVCVKRHFASHDEHDSCVSGNQWKRTATKVFIHLHVLSYYIDR